jgi:BMFP domain-containing protein YqiC
MKEIPGISLAKLASDVQTEVHKAIEQQVKNLLKGLAIDRENAHIKRAKLHAQLSELDQRIATLDAQLEAVAAGDWGQLTIDELKTK